MDKTHLRKWIGHNASLSFCHRRPHIPNDLSCLSAIRCRATHSNENYSLSNGPFLASNLPSWTIAMMCSRQVRIHQLSNHMAECLRSLLGSSPATHSVGDALPMACCARSPALMGRCRRRHLDHAVWRIQSQRMETSRARLHTRWMNCGW